VSTPPRGTPKERSKLAKGTIAGLIPEVGTTGSSSKKASKPSSYIRIYTNRADATFPDLLYKGETEQTAFMELFGSSSPSEMKRRALVLRRLLREGKISMTPVAESEEDEAKAE